METLRQHASETLARLTYRTSAVELLSVLVRTAPVRLLGDVLVAIGAEVRAQSRFAATLH